MSDGVTHLITTSPVVVSGRDSVGGTPFLFACAAQCYPGAVWPVVHN